MTPRQKIDVKLSALSAYHKAEAISNMEKQHGPSMTQLLILEEVTLLKAFNWDDSPQGLEYWADVLKETKIKEIGEQAFGELVRDGMRDITNQFKDYLLSKKESAETDNSKLDVMIQAAEEKGYKLGVVTMFGEIVEGYDHELLDNGDFYYHNIRVYKQGKWIEVLENMSREEIEKLRQINEQKEIEDFHDEIIKFFKGNTSSEKEYEFNGELAPKKGDHPFDGFDISLN